VFALIRKYRPSTVLCAQIFVIYPFGKSNPDLTGHARHKDSATENRIPYERPV
jgi:hypothetical protein